MGAGVCKVAKETPNMPRHIDQILAMAGNRPLSAGEIERLAGYIRDLERRQARPADVLERELARTREELKNCRRLLNKYDINEIMD
jgi:hypothetical protein